jgi:hypothetical protein
MLDVESEGNDCKYIPILQLIVLFHVIEQCLLVTYEEIKLEMVMNALIGWFHIASPEEIFPEVLQSI